MISLLQVITNDFATVFHPPIPVPFPTYPDIVRCSQQWIRRLWSSGMVDRWQCFRGNFHLCLQCRIMKRGTPVELLAHWGLLCEILGSCGCNSFLGPPPPIGWLTAMVLVPISLGLYFLLLCGFEGGGSRFCSLSKCMGSHHEYLTFVSNVHVLHLDFLLNINN